MAERALDVFLHDRLAGFLRRKDNGNLQFRYDGDYIGAGGQPLSWNLPLRSEAFAAAAGGVDRRPGRTPSTASRCSRPSASTSS